MIDTENEHIVSRDISEEMQESYLRYSLSVIISRALPDARDGLKPSQRRVLYAMRQLHLAPNSKHRKCAKICGDTSGDYHPHGETVVYPTLARMAQDWSMRYCLVQGQGNFGSIDGDPPGAMRYTEARLTAFAMALMADLDKETVVYLPNYDDTKQEPTVFPAKFPNLLCNGASGIAVGMATNIPPHNLTELASVTKQLIDDPTLSIDEMMKFMPAPDFPTGGVICGYHGVKEAYHTGKGKLTVRGKIRVEEMAGGNRQRLIVDEIPYGVNKSRLLERLADLVNNKTMRGISDIRDESDKDGMRIVLDLKRGEVPDVTINQLYKFTDLQTTFGCNMLALDHGLPRIMNVKQLLSSWVDHRIEVVRARTRFELAKAETRSHLLLGYFKALENLQEIVQLIRDSGSREVAKKALIERYGLTERQSHAVLDLRLYQLTGLEREKLENEYAILEEKIARFRAILSEERLVREILKEEIDEVTQCDRSGRKTEIVMSADEELEMEDLIANESMVITVSSDNYIKRMSTQTFREQKRGGQGVIGFDTTKRENDELKKLYVASTHDMLMIFTTLGRCYWLKVWQTPEAGRRSKGRPLVNFLGGMQVDRGEGITAILRVKEFSEPDVFILLTTKRGVVKKTSLSLFHSPRKKGVYAINLEERDEVISAHLVRGGDQVMLFTREGMAVRFEQDQIRPVGRVARGVRGVRLKHESDVVISSEIVREGEAVLVVCENGYGKRSLVSHFRQTHRGGVGVRSIITSKRNGAVVGALSVQEKEGIILMTSSGHTLRLNMKDFRVMGRSTQGVKVVNLSGEETVVAMQRVEPLEPDLKQDEDKA